jgi:hypothetical protein
MRLLHTKKLILETPTDTPYAILSHRWLADHEEISFQDLKRRQVPPSEGPHNNDAEPALPSKVNNKQGYEKFRGACDNAFQAGLEYIWIDTCCIDKTSSAELSEAINSMYAWYQDSAVCYVYLHDVGDDEDPRSGFKNADWFQRGWTLQELIAPDNVYFFNKSWIKIGSKATLVDDLNKITHIRHDILLGIPCITSIAEKMSWAAGRKTRKIEDRAYSLMGLFDVHMPIIYGEREKAFKRLQLEILKSSDDQSIFAWHDSLKHPNPVRIRGLLASAPDVFPRASPVVTMEHSHFINTLHCVTGSNRPFRDLPSGYSIANDGIEITLPMKKVTDGWLAVLRCQRADQEFPCGIYLTKISGCDGYLRTLPIKLQELERADLKDLIQKKIRIAVDHHILPTINRRQFFTFRSTHPVSEHRGCYICPNPGGHDVGQGGSHQVLNRDTWIELSDDVRCACIYLQCPRDKVIVLLIGIKHHRPWVYLPIYDDLHRFVNIAPSRRSTFQDAPLVSSPTSPQSSNWADPLAPSSPTSPQSSNQADLVLSSPTSPRYNAISSPRSQPLSRTFTRTNNKFPPRQFTAPSINTQLHGDGTGCPVCSIIRNYSINLNDIKKHSVDFVVETMLNKEIKVDIRKGQVRRVSEAMLEVNYVITVDLS